MNKRIIQKAVIIYFSFSFLFAFFPIVNAQEVIEEGTEVFSNSTLRVSVDLPEENGVRYVVGAGQIENIIYIPADTVVIATNIESDPLDPNSTTTIKETKILHSKWFYTMQMNVWTQGDVYESVKWRKISERFQWLQLIHGRDPMWNHIWGLADNDPNYPINRQNFSIGYDNYVIDEIVATGFNGRAQFNVSLDTRTPEVINFGDVEYRTTKQFEAIPVQIVVLESYSTNVGGYETIISESGETTTNALDVSEVSALEATTQIVDTGIVPNNNLKSNIANYLNSVNLGVTRLKESFQTIQQGTVLPAIVGTDDILDNGLLVNIKPNIVRIDEDLKCRSQKPLVVDTYTEIFSIDASGIEAPLSNSPSETILQRTIGWKIQHKATQAKLRIEFDVYSTVDITTIIEPTKPTLNLTTEDYDDNFLEDNLYGDTGVDIITSDQDPFRQWLEKLWYDNWYIFIIIIVVGVIAVFVYLRLTGKMGGGGGGTRKTEIKIGKFVNEPKEEE